MLSSLLHNAERAVALRASTPRTGRHWWTTLRLLVCLFLPGCGDQIAELDKQLSSTDMDARRVAARELGKLGGSAQSAIPALKTALSDDDREVRRMASYALGELGSDARSALPFLVGALGDDEQSVRLSAAFAIAKIDPESQAYVPILIEAMRSGDGGVIVAVGQMGERAEWAVPVLVSLLTDDPRPGIRRIAAEALNHTAAISQNARLALQRAAAQDEDDRVREAAAGVQ